METRHCFKDSKAAVLGQHRLCWRLFRRARANVPAQRHDDLSWFLSTLRKTTCAGAHLFACAANHDNVGLGRKQNPSSRWLL
ncbi:hypothetical protein M0657_007786 [Pyricularia oryzae]|nr:hypothetical protein M9X92_007494 [Pyricularia oryzae]KAI7918047.1 hypothetical protein M0657_007786 [Pyricularia oryzae]